MQPTDLCAAPIGIFDSGVGGLTVLRELQRTLPAEDFLYLGDTARVPYGTKAPETVRQYSVNNARYLQAQGCKAVVIACNTASASALDAVRESLRIPVIDVITPVAAAVASCPEITRVGVLGTRGTVASEAYPRALHAHAPHLIVHQQACPLFTPLAEEGWVEGAVPREVARTYLRPLLAAGPLDALILGCTHYPLLRACIRDTLLELGAPDIPLMDSGGPAAERTRALLQQHNALRSGDDPGQTRVLVTDDPELFARVSHNFMDSALPPAHHVDVIPT